MYILGCYTYNKAKQSQDEIIDSNTIESVSYIH